MGQFYGNWTSWANPRIQNNQVTYTRYRILYEQGEKGVNKVIRTETEHKTLPLEKQGEGRLPRLPVPEKETDIPQGMAFKVEYLEPIEGIPKTYITTDIKHTRIPGDLLSIKTIPPTSDIGKVVYNIPQNERETLLSKPGLRNERNVGQQPMSLDHFLSKTLVYDTSKYRNANDAARHNALTVVREDGVTSDASAASDTKSASERSYEILQNNPDALGVVTLPRDFQGKFISDTKSFNIINENDEYLIIKKGSKISISINIENQGNVTENDVPVKLFVLEQGNRIFENMNHNLQTFFQYLQNTNHHPMKEFHQ